MARWANYSLLQLNVIANRCTTAALLVSREVVICRLKTASATSLLLVATLLLSAQTAEDLLPDTEVVEAVNISWC